MAASIRDSGSKGGRCGGSMRLISATASCEGPAAIATGVERPTRRALRVVRTRAARDAR